MLSGQYDMLLVWMSVLVAILASYTALSLVVHVTRAGPRAARRWIAGGAFAMGTGIWAMHFVGMLAFRLPIEVGYDLAITLLSWLIPVLVSLLALWQLRQPAVGVRQLALSALLMGIGINTMHYVGMAAMQMQPGIVYSPWLVLLSVLISILASGASFWIAFVLNQRPDRWWGRLAGACAMGLAIVGMHYTGMAAAGFPDNSVCLAAGDGLRLDSLAAAVISAACVVLAVALLTSLYDARLKARGTMLALSQEVARERQVMLEAERRARAEAERARAEAERMSAMKDEFLSTLSHELRTPLHAILGWSQLLQSRAQQDAALCKGLQTIERNARAQGKLIEDLLDLSAIASGKVRLEKSVVSIAPLLEAAIDAAIPAAQEKGLHLVRHIDSQAGTIVADPARLQQVFANLITNAIKFTPAGGTVSVALDCVAPGVQISVADSGTGIGAEFLPHVFDLFRQADASTTRCHGGLGIGLSIVRQLVEMHGGAVTAASEGLGRGARLTVALPRLQVEDAAVAAGDPSVSANQCAQVNLAGVTVLVVDDDADALALARAMLEACQATVLAASSAHAALDVLTTRRVDALVSDIGMPGMDGLQLMAQVRSMAGAVAQVPAVALSAYTREKDREQALQIGFNAYLCKPLDAGPLVAAVAALVQARAAALQANRLPETEPAEERTGHYSGASRLAET